MKKHAMISKVFEKPIGLTKFVFVVLKVHSIY